MAFYKRSKLPPLRVSSSVSGSVSVSVQSRGQRIHQLGLSDSTSSSPPFSDAPSSPEPAEPDADYEPLVTNEPTSHELERKSAAKGWQQLRESLLSATVQSSSLIPGQKCVVCSGSNAIYRCFDCGPRVHYCEECFKIQHQSTNMFHVPEKWEGDHYTIHSFGPPTLSVVEPHNCSKPIVKSVNILCIDQRGMELPINFEHCQCEVLPVALIRAQLWPASPSSPLLCFTFQLMDWVEALLLECQVALKDFCQALYFACPFQLSQRRNIYAALIDSSEEYRIYKHNLRHLQFLCNDLDNGNVCPACPKEDGTVVLSMDGLFGLLRKKSAAFGFVCRHDFPSLFLNLKHGERLSYGVFLIDSLLEKYISQKIYIMYDIACTLHKHLKLCGREDVLERIKLCLPSFHAYGHKVSCQVVYGPLRCDGIGLSDGEGMERLWSYMRRFGRMTKEMRPAHRISVLSHALVYYGLRKKEKLCEYVINSLVLRWQRARCVYDASRESFLQLCSAQANTQTVVTVTGDSVRKWLDEEKSIVSTKHAFSALPRWKSEYFLLLNPFFKRSQKIRDGTLCHEQYLCANRELTRLDKLLKETEKKHNVSCRWSELDQVYVQVHQMFSEERKQQIGKALWAASTSRKFLLDLKSKYADGQKIAKKLSSQVTTETKGIQALLPEYNACLIASGMMETIDLKQALDPTELCTLVAPSSSLASGPKRMLIDSFVMMKRSDEELKLLESEKDNTLHHYTLKSKAIDATLTTLSKRDDRYSNGAVALLLKLKAKTNKQLGSCNQLFATVKQKINTNIIPLITEDDSDTDCDSSSDDENTLDS